MGGSFLVDFTVRYLTQGCWSVVDVAREGRVRNLRQPLISCFAFLRRKEMSVTVFENERLDGKVHPMHLFKLLEAFARRLGKEVSCDS